MRARRWFTCVGIMIVVGLLAALPRGWAKDDSTTMSSKSEFTDDQVTVRLEGAHHLLLPKDWPVSQRDGLLSPAPIEAYLSMKFGQVREKFRDTDQRLGAIEQRLDRLEQDQKNLLKGLRLVEDRLQAAQPQEVTHGDATQNPEAASGPSN